MRIKLIFLFFIFSSVVRSQITVEGKIIDASNKQPLAFVTIAVSGRPESVSTNIDGKFKISLSQPFSEINIRYVGYESMKFPVYGSQKDIVIKLKKTSYDLSLVEVRPGENPANRIIKLVTENRDKNNPEKITSYTCTTYSKTYYDLVYNNDEVKDKNDSSKVDSLKSRLRIFSESSHVLMMETETERKFLFPEHLNEKVVATKVSGFKNPSFSTSATDLQPFSFYDDYFKMLGKDYLNPISEGSTNKYFFSIEDTLFQGRDSVYIISYRPLKGKNFDGLEGVLYINTNGYAIQNVIATPYDKSLVEMKIQQQYQLIDGKQWFPEQLNYELHYKKYPTKYVGMKLTGKSFIRNVNLDTTLRKKDFDLETIAMEPDAARKNDEFWKMHRIDTLDAREKKTYVVIDSLGKKEHFDRSLRVIEALTTLQIPISVISIDINKIIGLNDYEVIRGGIGLHTNNRLSQWFSVGGYIGYGYKDSVPKFGGDVRINLKKNSHDFYIKALYEEDLAEPGRANNFYPKYNFSRSTMTYRMDYIKQEELSLNFRAFKFLTTQISLHQELRKPTYNYLYLPNEADFTEVSTAFKTAEVRIKGRYAFREKLVQSFGQLLSDGTKYPIIYFAGAKGFEMKNFGNYNYTKISLGIEKSFLIKNFGRTNFLLEGGYLQGNAPYSYLFNGNGCNAKGNYLYIAGNFQTMGLYEFLSDKYVNLFVSHNFGSLLFKRPKFQPQLLISTNIGYGSLGHPEQHKNLEFKTMEKGFYESGILLNNLIRVNYYNVCYLGFGGGAFMRYGAYAYPHMKDNLAYKISLVLTL